jgi:hypothetical protein
VFLIGRESSIRRFMDRKFIVFQTIGFNGFHPIALSDCMGGRFVYTEKVRLADIFDDI